MKGVLEDFRCVIDALVGDDVSVFRLPPSSRRQGDPVWAALRDRIGASFDEVHDDLRRLDEDGPADALALSPQLVRLDSTQSATSTCCWISAEHAAST